MVSMDIFTGLVAGKNSGLGLGINVIQAGH